MLKTIVENEHYTATPSKHNYLGDCVTVAYTLSKEQISENFLTDENIFLLAKTANDVFPIVENSPKLFSSRHFNNPKKVPLRIMSACITGLLGDQMCDCADDMSEHLSFMGKQIEGIFIYLPQEGQCRGLRTKLKDHRLQYGFDESGQKMQPMSFEGAAFRLFPDEAFDLRGYKFLKACFDDLGLSECAFSWLGGRGRMEKFIQESGLSVAYGGSVRG